MSNNTSKILKLIGIIILSILLYFVISLIFLGIYGTGSHSWFASILMDVLPVIIIGFVGYKVYKITK
jgi:uncharacterized membrane protein